LLLVADELRQYRIIGETYELDLSVRENQEYLKYKRILVKAMKGKILFIYPAFNIFRCQSGEIEARTLRIGFELLGYDVDVLGLDVSRTEDYNFFVAFTLCNDVCNFIDNLPDGAKIIVIPYLNANEKISKNANRTLKRKNVFVFSRSTTEFKAFQKYIPKGSIIPGNQWFLIPFKNELVESNDSEKELRPAFVMAEPERSSGVENLIAKGYSLNIFSESKESCWAKILKKTKNYKVKSRLEYGSKEWFKLIKDSEIFYEPNEYITSSVLERLYLGKKVLIQKNNSLLKEFQFEIQKDDLLEDFTKISVANNKNLFKYHVDSVARMIIQNL
jgi:hypothetical protein